MNTIGLSGEWRFAFDIKGAGLNYCGGWFERTLSETVVLPGSAVGNKKGIYNTMEDVDNRGDPWGYVGPAWYQKDFEIPPEAEGKNAVLILPRTCHTMVWVDETAIGESDCFQAPQVYELGRTAFPGKHRLTIRVDNSRRRLPPGWGRFLYLQQGEEPGPPHRQRIRLIRRLPLWPRPE
jgi:hypothetical protein